MGGDIPQATDYVPGPAPLLDAYGNDPRLRLVLYTLDEDTYSREMAPLAGGYAAVYLGAPWWFLDTPDALRRFREAVTDLAYHLPKRGSADDPHHRRRRARRAFSHRRGRGRLGRDQPW